MALRSDRSLTDWIAEYERGHQHPANRRCHTFGIPLVLSSVLLALGSLLWPALLSAAAATFVLGWALQFIGHAYEKKPPEFLKDWRFLLVGTRWWLDKVRNRPPSG
jgi:uncharacterized membrane protein YGL010W